MATQKASLLVDGEVLKQHILRRGEKHTPQQVLQYLYHMAQEIQHEFPDTELGVHYFGVRAADQALCPVSGERYRDIDVKKTLHGATLPNAELKTYWARMYYPFEEQWIMKPESDGKKVVSDEDFVLNEQPKGLLTKLVDTMLEKAVSHCENRLFVFGDAEDMEYALQTTNGLDMPTNQILLDGKRPSIIEFSQVADPKVCDKGILMEVAETLREPWAQNETFTHCLSLLRGFLGDDDKENILLLDMGVVRSHLSDYGMRMTVPNVISVVNQIKAGLPKKVAKTIFYHAVLD